MAGEREIDVVITAGDKYSTPLTQAEKDFKRSGETLGTSFQKGSALAVKSILKIAAALLAMQKAWDLANQAAQFNQQEQAFTNLTASHGENASQVISNLKKMSAGTIDNANLMKSAGTAMLLGIPIDRLEGMMKIARSSSRITGQTIQAAFEDISKGMGRQSKLILDNLGIMVDASKANEIYAESLGITVSALTDADRKQAFFNATMEAGEDTTARVGALNLTAAESMQKFSATAKNIGVFIGRTFILITSAVTGTLLKLSAIAHDSISSTLADLSRLTDWLSQIPGSVGEQFGNLSSALERASEFEKEAADIAFEQSKAALEVADSVFKAAEAVTAFKKPLEEAGDAGDEADKKLDKFRSAIARVVSATNQLGLSGRELIAIQVAEFEAMSKSKELAEEFEKALVAFAARKAVVEAEKEDLRIKEELAEVLKGITEDTNSLIAANQRLGKSTLEIVALDAAELQSKGASTDQLIAFINAKREELRLTGEISSARKLAREEEALGEEPEAATGGALPAGFGDVVAMQEQLSVIAQWHDDKLAILKAKNAEETEIQAAHEERKRALDIQTNQIKLQGARATFGNLASVAAAFAQQGEKQNKAAFIAYKTFAIAEALIGTYLAATKALAEVPYPFNFAAAASVVAAGIAQVIKIAGQNIGGGGSRSGGSVGRAAAAGSTVPGSTVGQTVRAPSLQAQPRPLEVTFNIHTLEGKDLNLTQLWEDFKPAIEEDAIRGGEIVMNIKEV